MKAQHIPIPYVTSLEDIYSEITEGVFPFVTFIVTNSGGDYASYVTIPFCRFRSCEQNNTLMEARSCDCEGVLCGHPVQRLYMSKSEMKNWICWHTEPMKYVFQYALAKE